MVLLTVFITMIVVLGATVPTFLYLRPKCHENVITTEIDKECKCDDNNKTSVTFYYGSDDKEYRSAMLTSPPGELKNGDYIVYLYYNPTASTSDEKYGYYNFEYDEDKTSFIDPKNENFKITANESQLTIIINDVQSAVILRDDDPTSFNIPTEKFYQDES